MLSRAPAKAGAQFPLAKECDASARLCPSGGEPPQRTLYLGVTSDLPQRLYQHRYGEADGFSKRYGCRNLVWYAACDDIQDARSRQLQMKKWKRAWKVQAIEDMNPDWRDLFEEIAH